MSKNVGAGERRKYLLYSSWIWGRYEKIFMKGFVRTKALHVWNKEGGRGEGEVK